MSHGAAGFAFAMVSLANAAARQDFAEAARECIAFENGSFDTAHANWPDFRSKEAHWRSQWCHGAVGIGLARTAIAKCSGWHGPPITDDIRNAVTGVQRSWPGQVDTLCCGLLGGVEFLNEAAGCLELDSLAGLAARRLAAVVEESTSVGDYRWNGGERRFNLGFFRGLAGIGYTCLRQIDRTLPNVLVWE
jgi:lantibiotic modifying enzyme